MDQLHACIPGKGKGTVAPRPFQAKPRRRSGVQDRRGPITGCVLLDEGPKVVEEKSRIGEGETIESTGKRAARSTVVNRKTTLLLAKIMPDKRADTLHKAALRGFHSIPAEVRTTLMRDTGMEFAAHTGLSQALAIDLYGAHPYHSWERGFNEHTNGLIRQYLPPKYPLIVLRKNRLTPSLIKSTLGPVKF